MSVADELQNLNDNILAAYTTIGNKGGTVPTDKNTDNLATAIGSIPNGGGRSEPGGNIKITAYDTTTGVISGGGFGSTPGYVYVLDRDTNTYVPQTVASWTPSSITLDTPVDLTTLEGTTSMAVVADDGTWSNKWLLTGDVAVSGWGKLYVQNPDTRAIYTVAVTSQADFEAIVGGGSNVQNCPLYLSGGIIYSDEVVGFQFGSDYNFTPLPGAFLGSATNFMQPLVLPFGITEIPSWFLSYAYKFNQPLTIPASVTNISERFLSNCMSFNQPITIPSSVTNVGEFFMGYCWGFNQPVVLSSEMASTPANFLSNCYIFNQPVTIPNSVTTIQRSFLSNCSSFNQPLTIPSSVTRIENNFLSSCSSFNQPLTIPSGVSYIGDYFLSNCNSFNQPLTIQSSISQGVGARFAYNARAFSNLIVEVTSRTPENTYSLASDQATSKMYAKGITVKGAGRSTWISALPNRTSNPYRKLIDGGE